MNLLNIFSSIKSTRGVEVEFLSFLTLALDRSKYSETLLRKFWKFQENPTS
jgi:hypothetical protein